MAESNFTVDMLKYAHRICCLKYGLSQHLLETTTTTTTTTTTKKKQDGKKMTVVITRDNFTLLPCHCNTSYVMQVTEI